MSQDKGEIGIRDLKPMHLLGVCKARNSRVCPQWHKETTFPDGSLQNNPYCGILADVVDFMTIGSVGYEQAFNQAMIGITSTEISDQCVRRIRPGIANSILDVSTPEY